MAYIISEIKVLDERKILVVFRNGIEKIYDVRTLYAQLPQFEIFEDDIVLFEQVRVDTGGYGISWNDELDLSADELWENGAETGRVENVDVMMALAENLSSMRKSVGMTQVQLSKKTGIDQADISKIERGLANPSLLTLKRLADGMGVELRIEYVSRPER